MNLDARRFVLSHQLMIVRCDDDGRAKAIEFDKQTQ